MEPLNQAIQLSGLSVPTPISKKALLVHLRNYDAAYTTWRLTAESVLRDYATICSEANLKSLPMNDRNDIFLKLTDLFLPILQLMIYPASLRYRTLINPPTKLGGDITGCFNIHPFRVLTARDLYWKFNRYDLEIRINNNSKKPIITEIDRLVEECRAADVVHRRKKSSSDGISTLCDNIRSAIQSVHYFLKEEQTWTWLIKSGFYWSPAMPERFTGKNNRTLPASWSDANYDKNIQRGEKRPEYVSDLPPGIDEEIVAIAMQFRAMQTAAKQESMTCKKALSFAEEYYRRATKSAFTNISNANREIEYANDRAGEAEHAMQQLQNVHRAMTDLIRVYTKEKIADLQSEYRMFPWKIGALQQHITEIQKDIGFIEVALKEFDGRLKVSSTTSARIKAAIGEAAPLLGGIEEANSTLVFTKQESIAAHSACAETIRIANEQYLKAEQLAFANTAGAREALAGADTRADEANTFFLKIQAATNTMTALSARYNKRIISGLVIKYGESFQINSALDPFINGIAATAVEIQGYLRYDKQQLELIPALKATVEAAIAEGAAVLSKLEEYTGKLQTAQQKVVEAGVQAGDIWYVRENAEKAKNSAVALANESAARSKAAANAARAIADKIPALLETLNQSKTEIEGLQASYAAWFAEMASKYGAKNTVRTVLMPKLDATKVSIEKALEDINRLYRMGVDIQGLANSNATEAEDAREALKAQFEEAIERAKDTLRASKLASVTQRENNNANNALQRRRLANTAKASGLSQEQLVKRAANLKAAYYSRANYAAMTPNQQKAARERLAQAERNAYIPYTNNKGQERRPYQLSELPANLTKGQFEQYITAQSVANKKPIPSPESIETQFQEYTAEKAQEVEKFRRARNAATKRAPRNVGVSVVKGATKGERVLGVRLAAEPKFMQLESSRSLLRNQAYAPQGSVQPPSRLLNNNNAPPPREHIPKVEFEQAPTPISPVVSNRRNSVVSDPGSVRRNSVASVRRNSVANDPGTDPSNSKSNSRPPPFVRASPLPEKRTFQPMQVRKKLAFGNGPTPVLRVGGKSHKKHRTIRRKTRKSKLRISASSELRI